MSRRWIQNPNRCSDEYLDGIEDFIEFARRQNPDATRIRCPCRKCNNTLWETIENVGFHLVRNGMIETYSIWNLHGEQLDHASSSNATRMDSVEPIVDHNDQVMDIIEDVFPFASTNINNEREDDVPTPIDSAEFEQYEKLLKNANQELYPGCERFSVLTAIVELMTAIFFSQLTIKTLRKTDILQLRHDIVQVLCKFEMICPPAFFTSMMHVMVHLPEEASLACPVNYRWMYPIERLLGELKKSVRNRAKPEGSIIEAWVQYESLTFCGMYLKDVETAFNRPQRNNDGGMRKEKLSVFAQSARPFGDPGRGESFSTNDMEVAHWFVLNNCDEIMAYLDEHEEMMKREHPSHLVAQKQRELFPQWFWNLDELNNLAFGPIRAELFSGCYINGVKFLGPARDDKLCTQNSGVHVPGGGESTNIDFYGKLTNVVQLLYKDRYQVIMFKCRWFDSNPNRPGSVKIDHGLLSVNINRTWYDDNPYILANMATQIVYLDDPKAGSNWKVVQKMDHRNVYAIPELDGNTDNDVDNVADQRLESSMENDADTLRDTHVIQEPFQIQGVSSIEIPIQSITIDLGDLPRFDVAVGPSSEDDVVIADEDEEDWETESDDSDDNESYYSSDDE
ncbi:hypothetical protein Prudu_005627 [Prunus dulcis]|uniref:Ankyrin repeat family protein n=1 Tax=Prunus dulcis TaxID=3755 RepID=A0A4Y1QY34_PRUDU|nr:hypothetical protein Prudu_005627 [Prunus dulcis]